MTYARAKNDILKFLKENRAQIVTTFLDFYGMGRGFPFRDEVGGLPTVAKAERIEQGVLADIEDELGDSFDSRRFIPYIQMHEFEGLLFSDPQACANGLYEPGLTADLERIRREYETPEDINDSYETKASIQLANVCDEYDIGYEKSVFGNLAALEVGLQKMRQECPHFNDWLTTLECRIKELP